MCVISVHSFMCTIYFSIFQGKKKKKEKLIIMYILTFDPFDLCAVLIEQ